MNKKIRILNFDHCYDCQDFFKAWDYDYLNLEDIRGTSAYCSRSNLREIDHRLEKGDRPFINFLGSGNYHYISYLLTSKLEEEFTLIVFDNHTDMLNPSFESLISCGSWANSLLEDNKMLHRLIVIGVDDSYLKLIPYKFRDKIEIVSHKDIVNNINLETFLSRVFTENVYISIDKDVLSQDFAATNWDQGILSRKRLLDILDYILREKRVLGVDVCGELRYDPSRNFQVENRLGLKKNNLTNELILDTVLTNRSVI